MVRILEDTLFVDGKHYIYAAGKSTDTRPNATMELVTGSVYLEVDTKAAHFYDEESGKWDDEEADGDG